MHKFLIFWPRNSKFKCKINYQNNFKKIKKQKKSGAFRTNSLAKIDGPVTFLLYDLECYFFWNDSDIGCGLELKNGLGNYDPDFRNFFWDTL